MQNNNIVIKIEGEIGKHQTIPVDYLITLAKHLQSLIIDIAHYDLPSDQSIDLNNYKLELTDFKKSSSVPIFCFTANIQNTIQADIFSQRKEVSKKFDALMNIAGNSDYLKLNEFYKEPEKRNKITESLYQFVNSLGTSPVSISDNTIKKIHQIKPFKKEIRDKIISGTIDVKGAKKEKTTKEIVLARVEISEGKIKPKVLELFDKKYAHVTFAPELIHINNKTYNLKFPLTCTMDYEDGAVIIEHRMLGIYASGNTPNEAEIMFNEEFDYLFKRYTSLPDKKLTDDVKAIKSFLNHIVKH